MANPQPFEVKVNGRWRRYDSLREAARKLGLSVHFLRYRLSMADPLYRRPGVPREDAEAIAEKTRERRAANARQRYRKGPCLRDRTQHEIDDDWQQNMQRAFGDDAFQAYQ